MNEAAYIWFFELSQKRFFDRIPWQRLVIISQASLYLAGVEPAIKRIQAQLQFGYYFLLIS